MPAMRGVLLFMQRSSFLGDPARRRAGGGDRRMHAATA